jgi:uncharacterized protein (TIGR00369 family)
MNAVTEHPERQLVRTAIERQLRDLPVDTNPLAQALSMRPLEAAQGKVRVAFRIPGQFLQGNGFVQGGIIAAMLDFGMAFAAFSSIPANATVTSVSQTTNYFRPVSAGELTVEAELEKAGRTIVNARASLFDTAGKLLAGATAPFAVIIRSES